jgi:hypothetical protein
MGIGWMYGSQVQAGLPGVLLGTLVALVRARGGCGQLDGDAAQPAHGHAVDLVPAVLVGAVLSAIVTLPLALPLAWPPHDLALLGLLGVFQLAIPARLVGALRARAQGTRDLIAGAAGSDLWHSAGLVWRRRAPGPTCWPAGRW